MYTGPAIWLSFSIYWSQLLSRHFKGQYTGEQLINIDVPPLQRFAFQIKGLFIDTKLTLVILLHDYCYSLFSHALCFNL